MAKHNRQTPADNVEGATEENDHVVDDVDTSAPQLVQDSPETATPAPTSDDDRVVGRRNEDLPLENPRS